MAKPYLRLLSILLSAAPLCAQENRHLVPDFAPNPKFLRLQQLTQPVKFGILFWERENTVLRAVVGRDPRKWDDWVTMQQVIFLNEPTYNSAAFDFLFGLYSRYLLGPLGAPKVPQGLTGAEKQQLCGLVTRLEEKVNMEIGNQAYTAAKPGAAAAKEAYPCDERPAVAKKPYNPDLRGTPLEVKFEINPRFAPWRVINHAVEVGGEELTLIAYASQHDPGWSAWASLVEVVAEHAGYGDAPIALAKALRAPAGPIHIDAFYFGDEKRGLCRIMQMAEERVNLFYGVPKFGSERLGADITDKLVFEAASSRAKDAPGLPKAPVGYPCDERP